MGRYLFRLPDIGEGVTEAEIVAWHVKVGDVVAEDSGLVDVMTDKATVDISSPVAGVITALHGDVGASMPVGSVVVELEIEDPGNEAVGAPAPAAQPPPSITAPASAPWRSSPPETAVTSNSPPPNAAPLASPATRRRAHELGISLQYVRGTGPGGRITGDDLEAYLRGEEMGDLGRAAQRTSTTEIPIVGIRRRIAEKMQMAKSRIPHISYVEEIDLTEVEALRGDLNAHRRDERPKLTLLPFFMRTLARALQDFPEMNAHYDDHAGVLRVHSGIHIGIATHTPAGLVVPVVRHVEALDLWNCAMEVLRLSSAARDSRLAREELSGSTITLTSLGALGGIASTPIINHPEVAIVGPNKIVERPVVHGGFVSVRKVMNLSCSFDHRIVDGYDAASFAQRLKRLLEHPALIFMDDVDV